MTTAEPVEPAVMADFQVSLSQAQAYRKCQQSWAYATLEGLKPRVGAPPLDLGSVLHAYLEVLYQGYQAGGRPDDVHPQAIAAMRTQYADYLTGMANVAYAMGAMQEGDTFSALLPKAERIAERYLQVRGRGDHDRYEILLIEQRLRARVAPGIISVGVADLVARDRVNGRVYLFEHKSTTSVPSHGYRLRDLQTVLYTAKLKPHGVVVQGVLWNYLYTREPEKPELTGAGKMSKVKRVTTWDVYREALLEAGLRPEDYQDMQQKLAGAEEEQFFPRYDYLVSTDGKLLLEDYRTTTLAMRDQAAQWKRGEGRPVRSLSRDCDYCSYAKICTAVLTGDNVDAVLTNHYTTPQERRERYGTHG